jgi:aldehyde:ferredoxin oxidoreductase
MAGTIGDSSVGGNFGRQLKRAGWDGIVILRKSDQLCGIEIIDDKILIMQASHLTKMAKYHKKKFELIIYQIKSK